MKALTLFGLSLFLCLPAVAQEQEDVTINRYTVYTGFDYFNNPGLSLSQRGFDTDFGVTVKPWFALGADFSASGNSIINGSGTINGSSTVFAPLCSFRNIGDTLLRVSNADWELDRTGVGTAGADGCGAVGEREAAAEVDGLLPATWPQRAADLPAF